MKKIITFTITICLIGLLTHGQQRLSYSYDAAGNRISRTVIVGAQAISGHGDQESTSRTYIDSLDGKELSILAGRENPFLSVFIKGIAPSSGASLSLMDRGGKILTEQAISGEPTIVKLDELSTGVYALRILLNRRSSTWKLIKL